MPKYLIERELPGAGNLTADELKIISQKSCGVIRNLGPQIQWVRLISPIRFIQGALPLLDKDGIDLWIYYVSSAELFDALPQEEQQSILPEERATEALGITGFTLATMYRWVKSDLGRSMSLYPFKRGRFLGSGQGSVVLAEAGLDGISQYHAIRQYLAARQ